MPGYRAPAERTTGPDTQVIAGMLAAVADGVIDSQVQILIGVLAS